LNGVDAWIGAGDFIQQRLASARDDDFVSTLVERFGQSAADARGAASNEDGVCASFHDLYPFN
jgi:hypothetical protein